MEKKTWLYYSFKRAEELAPKEAKIKNYLMEQVELVFEYFLSQRLIDFYMKH